MGYLEYFKFSKPPFEAVPTPEFIYKGIRLQDAVAHFRNGLEARGSGLITGDPYTGKTVLAHMIMEALPESRFHIVYIPSLILDTPMAITNSSPVIVDPNKPIAMADSIELMGAIARGLPVKPTPAEDLSHLDFAEAIRKRINELREAGKEILIVLDDAEHADDSCLELIDVLTRPAYESSEGLRLQFLMVSTNRFRERLEAPEYSGIHGRISTQFNLLPLSREETEFYMVHRIKAAGVVENMFDIPGVTAIHTITEGYPALINNACKQCFEYCVANEKLKVDRETAMIATGKMEAPKDTARRNALIRRAKIAGIALVGGTAVVLLIVWLSSFLHFGEKKSSSSGSSGTSKTDTSKDTRQGFKGMGGDKVDKKMPSSSNPSTLAGGEAKEKQTVGGEGGGKKNGPEKPVVSAINSTLEAVPPGVEHPLHPVAEDPLPKPIVNEMAPVYQRFFALWRIAYDPRHAPATPCDFARVQGLMCINAEGSLEDLARFDRPALILLPDKKGKKHLGLMERISPTSVRITMGKLTYHLPRAQVVQQWTPYFVFLWRVPADLIGIVSLEMGMQGWAVAWLRERLEFLLSMPHPDTSNRRDRARLFFDASLRAPLHQYQALRGLPESDVADFQTLLSISLDTPDPDIPHIVTQEPDPAPLSDWPGR